MRKTRKTKEELMKEVYENVMSEETAAGQHRKSDTLLGFKIGYRAAQAMFAKEAQAKGA